MQYRADIDGLRAVAVVPILLFHAGIATLSGGFVGVDVFFVISGFLITKIIFREMEEGHFSIFAFYRRRMVRIFPALFAILIFTLIYGCFTLLPTEIRDVGWSAASSSAFISNIYFWRSADYFAPAAELMPLLHTWSLGIEEQFYIFYPIFLIIARRYFSPHVVSALIAIVVLSLAIGAALVWVAKPEAAFYLLPSRAWQLALGGLVALGAAPAIREPRSRGLAALAGLALVTIGYFVIRPDMAVPAPWGLLPCIGSALLIAYGEKTVIGTLLGTAAFRLIGRISYSLYLWHWPIISFYRIETGIELEPLETAGLVIASFAIATLSYNFIEQPFLTRFRKASVHKVTSRGGAALVMMVALSLLVAWKGPGWRHFDPAVVEIDSYADYSQRQTYRDQFRPGPCFRGGRESAVAFDPTLCAPLASDRPNIVIVGDSHAAQYWRAFALRFHDSNVMQATASGCRPLLKGTGSARCREAVDYVLGPLLQTGRVDIVILGGRWEKPDLPLLRGTVDHIAAAGAKAVVLGPTVEYQGEFPLLLARSTMRHDLSSLADFRTTGRSDLDSQMASILRSSGATYVSVLGLICKGGECRTRAPDGAPMQFDYGHLTLSGARWVVDQMPPFEVPTRAHLP